MELTVHFVKFTVLHCTVCKYDFLSEIMPNTVSLDDNVNFVYPSGSALPSFHFTPRRMRFIFALDYKRGKTPRKEMLRHTEYNCCKKAVIFFCSCLLN